MASQTRVAVRVVLLDAISRVLLLEGREVLEETGQSGLRLVGPFHRRELDFPNHGEQQHQVEHFFAARTADTSIDDRRWTELERKALTRWRWWSIEELETTPLQFFPDNLADLVRRAASLL